MNIEDLYWKQQKGANYKALMSATFGLLLVVGTLGKIKITWVLNKSEYFPPYVYIAKKIRPSRMKDILNQEKKKSRMKDNV